MCIRDCGIAIRKPGGETGLGRLVPVWKGQQPRQGPHFSFSCANELQRVKDSSLIARPYSGTVIPGIIGVHTVSEAAYSPAFRQSTQFEPKLRFAVITTVERIGAKFIIIEFMRFNDRVGDIQRT